MKLETHAALLALAVPCLASSAAAQGTRLNAPFPPDAIGSVQRFALSPTEARAVYAADQDEQGVLELYNVPTDGGAAPFKLAMPGIRDENVVTMQVSQDGEFVVLRTDLFHSTFDRLGDLHQVPMDGSGPAILLNGAMVSGGSVESWLLGATRVVYVADALVDGVFELFSVPIDGSAAPIKLNGTLASGRDVFNELALSPDGTRVLYRAQSSLGAFDIHSVPIDGSAPSVRLNAPLAGGRVARLTLTGSPFSADSSRVAYIADQDSGGVFELFSVPADGSAGPLKLHLTLAAGRNVDQYSVGLTGRVAYRADQDTDEVFELYSVPIDGSAVPAKLNGLPVAGGDVHDFRIDPTGQRVVYRANELLVGRTELFSAPIDGSAARVRLNGTLLSNSLDVFDIVPSGQRVVYLADQEGNAERELYSVPTGGGASVRLSQVLGASETLVDFMTAGGRVLYRHQTTHVFGSSTVFTRRLFSAPVGGVTAPLELSRSVVGDELELPLFDAPGNRAVYLAHRAWAPGIMGSFGELFSAPLAGGPDPVKLHPELALGGTRRDVSAFAHTPDGRWVVYVADQETDELPELFAVRADGTGAPFKLNAPISPPELYMTFVITPDSSRVVYSSFGSPASNLFSVRVDGSAAAIPISPPGTTSPTLVSPDSQRVVYLLGGLVYSVPIDGSASPVPLLGALVPGGHLPGDLTTTAISPDSTRFVFIADKETDEIFELYSVPLDGSAQPTKLSGAIVAEGDATTFRISPDGTRVVFTADRMTNEVHELFSAPIDGSAAPVKVSGTQGANGDVLAIATEYAISPDSSWVVYRADQVADGRFELFSAPIDGSAAPLRLNATLPAGGDVTPPSFWPSFLISPDSTRVVYRADQAANDLFELFGAPIDASAAPVKLSGTMIPGGDIEDRFRFEISADGTRVVYLADALVDFTPMLFSAPIDGSASPTQLSEGVNVFELCPSGAGAVYLGADALFYARLDGSRTGQVSVSLPADRSIIDFEVSPDSTRVVYRADAADDEVFELWLRNLVPHPRPAAGPGASVTRGL